MSIAIQNVTKLNSNRVYNHIISFLNGKRNNSKNTAKAYEADIKQFFLYYKGKTIEQLDFNDLAVLMSDIYDYRTYLSNIKKYKNNVVNQKISAIRSLYRFLKGNGYDVNPEAFDIGNLQDDSKKRGFLNLDEVLRLAELAIECETHNKYMKRALIFTAFATSMREDALLKLRYSDIRPSEDPNKYIIEPDYLDKGKKIYKEIHAKVYNYLVEAREKDVRVRKDDKIFTMDTKGIQQMMKRLCEKAGFDPRRNITFHSIRKAGADFVYEITGGDIFAVTSQGNWSNPKTVHDRYLKQQANVAGMAAFEIIDDDIFEQLTHDELLKLVKSIKSGLGIKLKREAKYILDNRGSEI